MSVPPKRIIFYLAALIAPVFAILLRLALEREYGELAPFLISYPVVALAAFFGGLWAGLLATTVSALVVTYWVLPPRWHFGIEKTTDAIGLAIFCVMGVGMSVAAELYHRNRQKLATYEKEQAIREALGESEKRFRALVAASSDVIYHMSPDWSEMRLLRSQSFLAPTEAPSRTWLQKYIHADDQAHVMAVINEAIRTKSIFELEHRIIRTDGSLGWTVSRAVPLLDEDGEITEWFGAASDIADRKRAEEVLLRSEKLAATGRLAATIAHEVNNPLSAAMNAAYIASTDPTQTSEMLKVVEQELRHAAHITQQTLGFYRDSSGRVQQIALPKLIDEVLAVYAGKLKNRNITVRRRCYCCPGSCTARWCPEKCENCEGRLLVDAGEMRQIISSLLANGIDALSDGGVLQIRVARLSNRLQLTMADNGCGIRTEHLKRIFEPFFTTKQAFGTGLGLWVTEELVRKHNGVIKVRSRKGQGTVFRIAFSAVPPSSSTGSDSSGGGLNLQRPLLGKKDVIGL